MGILMKNGVNYTGFGAKNIAVAHYDSIGIPQVFFSDKAGNKVNCGLDARYITTITTDPIAFFKWKHTDNGDWVQYGAVSLRPLTEGVDYNHNNEHADLVDPIILSVNGVTAYVYKESGGWSFSNNPDVVINDTYHISNLYATDADITATSKFMKDIVATLTDGYTLPQEVVVRYSLAERQIGTWIDGKPLYEKSFTGTFTVTTTSRKWYNIYSVNDISSLHIDKCMFIQGLYKEPTISFYVDMGVMKGNDGIYCTMAYNQNEGINFVVCNGATGTAEFIFTLRYTKTTD